MVRRRRYTMDRSASHRALLWYRKMDGNVYKMILDRVKEQAFERFLDYQAVHEWIIKKVRETIMKLDPNGNDIYDHTRMQAYVWFAQGLWYISQRYKGNALKREAQALFWYFHQLGLRPEALIAVSNAVGIDIMSALRENVSRAINLITSLGIPAYQAFFKTRRYKGEIKTINWTDPRVVDEVLPSEENISMVIDRIVLYFENPKGSKCTLYVKGVLLYKFAGESECIKETIPEGKKFSYDYLREYLSRGYVDNDVLIGFRLYAWCSKAPRSGYEPKCGIVDFSAVQL